MASTPLHYQSLTEVAGRIHAGEISSSEVTRAILDRIEAVNVKLHAYATVMASAALAQAKAADAEIGAGRIRGPLHGVPIAVKDLCYTKGTRTRAGMPIHDDFVPTFDATVVTRFNAAGAVILGKLELTESAFAFHHPDITPPDNPWRSGYWTGVSSSGSGAATAAGLCYASLGSDTGGSIRFPSLGCGVTGLKPTWGRVSTYGVFPLSNSLDHIGPMTRTAADAAAVLGIIAGADDNDPTAILDPVPDYLAALDQAPTALRVGYDEAYCTEGVDPVVAKGVKDAVAALAGVGAEIVPIAMPEHDELINLWGPFCAAECALHHERTYPARADEYGPSLKGLIDAGIAATGIDLARGNVARSAFKGQLARMFQNVDMIAAPSLFIPTPLDSAIEELAAGEGGLYKLVRFTAPYDFSGSPTISLPCGFSAEGLPLGFQLIGPHLGEGLLLRSGHAYQQATDWSTRHPEI